MADDRPGSPGGDRPEDRPATSPTEPLHPPTEPPAPPPPPGAGPAPTTPLPEPPAAGGPPPAAPPPAFGGPSPTTPVPEPPAAGGPPPPPGYGQPGYGPPGPGAPYGGQPGYGPPGYGAQPGYGYGYPAGPPTDSSATAALVIAIVGFFICPPVGAVVALVMANSAEKRIEASEGRLGGLELARAARIIAIVELVLTAILIVGGILAIAASLGSRY
jgi:hypothetical protein